MKFIIFRKGNLRLVRKLKPHGEAYNIEFSDPITGDVVTLYRPDRSDSKVEALFRLVEMIAKAIGEWEFGVWLEEPILVTE